MMQKRLLASGGSGTDPLQHALNDRLLCYIPVAVAAHAVVSDFTSSAAGSLCYVSEKQMSAAPDGLQMLLCL